jgi:glycosyltransferase involved in cell wall biosynthesis
MNLGRARRPDKEVNFMALNKEVIWQPEACPQGRAANTEWTPIRVLIVNHEYPPIGGGASKVSGELSRRLVAQGHRVVVVTSRSRGLPKFENIDGIDVHRVWTWRKNIHDGGLRGSATFLLSALPHLRRILSSESIDVVHFFFGLPTGLLSFYTHGVRRLPYIVGLRGSDVPHYDDKNAILRLLHRLLLPLTRRIWRGASAVFAVSHGLKNLAQQTTPELPIRVIHNGIDIVETVPELRIKSSNSPIRLLSVARLVPRKGIDLLLEAIATTDRADLDLTIAGTGPSLAALEEQARSLGIGDRVHFEGFCSVEKLRVLNLESDIFVLPTLSDAFPNAVLEAMGAALPVVASNVGGIPEAVVDEKSGLLVEAGNVSQLREAIEKLAGNPGMRKRLGEAGQIQVEQRFTWKNNALQYVQSYEKAIAREIPAARYVSSG